MMGLLRHYANQGSKQLFLMRYKGRVQIGRDCHLSYLCFRPHVERLVLGNGVRLGERLFMTGREYRFGDHFYCGNEIIFGGGPSSYFEAGKYSSIAHRVVFIMGRGNHRPQSLSNFPFGHAPHFDAPEWTQNFDYEGESATYCKIGNDVWIGVGSMILPNVRIGDGAIVSAGSVVKDDVPPYAIAGGNPASVIAYRFKSRLIDELLEMKWWDWTEEKINRNKPLFTRNLMTRPTLEKVPVEV